MIRFLSAFLLLATPLFAAPKVDWEVHQPCNLFEPSTPIVLNAKLRSFPAGKATAVAVATNYQGREVARKTDSLDIAADSKLTLDFDFGKLGRGYYEITLTVTDGTGVSISSKATVGVMEFSDRTAEQVRDDNWRFGMKWGGIRFEDPNQVKTALVKLGLQWTRIGQTETAKLLEGFPINAVVKIERFPPELYDAERYGPMEEWEKKFGKGQWKLKTLPKKGPYQEWLRQELATNIPKDQNIFEIWNEPWDKLSPEDFAELSQWIAEVVLKERPNAILGQNLGGQTSEFSYDAKVAKAGGLKGMKMVALHIYGFPEDRTWLREYRQWINQQAGRELDVYITEYGHHSAPEGPSKSSEQNQANIVVRRSLGLYAEGSKALLPHWIGQQEKNPTYQEDWYGYIRANLHPKPALIAYANCARLIDHSRYLGDLWFGPQVEAFVFERGGTYTLAVFGPSGKEVDPAPREIEIPVPAGQKVTVVDMIGQEETVTSDGRVKVTAGPEPVYIVGLDAALAKQASMDLRADRWPVPERPPRNSRVAHRPKSPIVCDGQFDDWKGATELSLFNVKVNPEQDCSGVGYVAWDDEYLYIGANMRDNELLNTRALAKLYQQDSMELFISTLPRDKDRGFSPYDFQFFLTPTSADGQPVFAVLADREAGKLAPVEGAKFFGGKTARGWAIEAAIPWSILGGFKPGKDKPFALEMRVNDADTSHERFKIDPEDGNVHPEDPTVWSLLSFEE